MSQKVVPIYNGHFPPHNFSSLVYPECASVQYDCGERCIPKSNVCNGYIDCADGSDETDCSKYIS